MAEKPDVGPYVDKIANGAVVLYAVQRAKGKEEAEAVFIATRKTVQIIFEEMVKKFNTLPRGPQ